MAFIAWPEIESFHNVRKFTSAHPEILNGNSTVSYRCKVKLHGTNAAVQIHSDGRVIAQSRTAELSVENDNAGFARWVKENEALWQDDPDSRRKCVIIYGEWIGPGIQKGVAANAIPKKCFAVFAARPLDKGGDDVLDRNSFWIDPEHLRGMIRGIPDAYALPWHSTDAVCNVDANFELSSEELAKTIEPINAWVDAIETNDPWVETVFGINGTGEGLVFYPFSKEHLGMVNFTNLVFKAKGEKHKNIKTSAPAQVDASAAASINQFVDMVLTDARLEQGAVASAGTLTFDMKLLGKFIAWIVSDVEKETKDELTASNLVWKQVSKPVSNRARDWYIEKFKST